MPGVRVCRDQPARGEGVHVSNSEGRATHAGPESGARLGNGVRAALTADRCRQGREPRNRPIRGPTRASPAAGHSGHAATARRTRTGGVEDPWQARKHRERDPGAPASGLAHRRQARTVNRKDTTVRYGRRRRTVPEDQRSDRTTGPMSDEARSGPGGNGGGRGGKGTGQGPRGPAHQGPDTEPGGLSPALDPVRQAARDRAIRLNGAVASCLRQRPTAEAYDSLHHDAAPGVDGQTWAAYGEPLETTRRMCRTGSRGERIRPHRSRGRHSAS